MEIVKECEVIRHFREPLSAKRPGFFSVRPGLVVDDALEDFSLESSVRELLDVESGEMPSHGSRETFDDLLLLLCLAH